MYPVKTVYELWLEYCNGVIKKNQPEIDDKELNELKVLWYCAFLSIIMQLRKEVQNTFVPRVLLIDVILSRKQNEVTEFLDQFTDRQ